MGSLEFVYVKQYELPNTADHDHVIQGCLVYMAAHIRSQRPLDVPTNSNVKQHKAEIHDVYPTSKSFPDEKIIFRDLPIDVGYDYILDYLDAQPGIKVKSIVIHAKLRDSRNNLTRFYSGERFVYV